MPFKIELFGKSEKKSEGQRQPKPIEVRVPKEAWEKVKQRFEEGKLNGQAGDIGRVNTALAESGLKKYFDVNYGEQPKLGPKSEYNASFDERDSEDGKFTILTFRRQVEPAHH